MHKLSIAITLCFALLTLSPGCEAQYFGLGSGLGYYGIGSSLLYPLNSLFYSGSNYTWPLYGFAALGSGFANNAIYNSYRNIPYNYNNNYAVNNSYSPYNGTNSNYPFNLNYNNYNPNQNQTSGWNYSPNPITPPFPQSTDPNDIFNSAYPRSSSNLNQQNETIPATAPDRHLSVPTTNATTPGNFVPNTKILEGFFQTVNTRYKGNLFHALNQSDMCAWAESVGLIQTSSGSIKNINQSRKNEISIILKDASLDPQKKLDVLRLLLNTN